MIRKNKAVVSLFSYVFYVLISIIVLALIIASASKVISKNQESYNYNKMIENINNLDQTINKVATTRFSNINIEVYNPDKLTIDCANNKIIGSIPYSSNIKTEKTKVNGITIYKKQAKVYFEKIISGYDLIDLTCSKLTLNKGKSKLGVTYFDYNISNNKVDIDITPIKNRTNNWYNSAWKYRKLIIINHNKVEGTLTDFPVLISIKDPKLINRIKDDGSDVIFTIDNGNGKLYREIEDYNNQTGSLVAWVNIPKLNNTEDYKIYMYYGNPDANEPNDTLTWNNNYTMVQHFNNLLDSTDNVHDINSYNFNNTSNSNLNANGIGNAFKLDGIDDYLITPSIDWNINDTLSLWINLGMVSSLGYFIGGINNSGIRYNNNNKKLLIYNNSSGYQEVPYTAQNKLINFVAERINGTDYNVFINGNFLSTFHAGDTSNTIQINYIGKRSDDNYYFNGIMDEVRLLKTPESVDWIKTEYNNESNPTTFITVGAQGNR